MRSIRRLSLATTAILIVLLSEPSLAVIKPDMPPYKIYLTASAVVMGEVTEADAAGAAASIKITSIEKGAFAPESLTLAFKEPSDIAKDLKVGDRFILFVARRSSTNAVMHCADTWLMAAQDGAPDKWVITKSMQDMGWSCFPGRTWQLARHIAELKAGQHTLMVGVDHNLDLGAPGARKVDVKPGASAILAVDINGDKKADLVVVGPGGAQLLVGDGQRGFSDVSAPWGLTTAAGDKAAAGDVNGDGKPDLLIGDQLYINAGDKFMADQKVPLPPRTDLMDVTLADASGDGKPDVVALKKDGEAVGFVNPGASGKPWTALLARKTWAKTPEPVQQAVLGDWNNDGKLYAMAARQHAVERYGIGDGAETFADYTRLTGRTAKDFPWGPQWGNGLEKISHLVAGDFDKDGRRDLFVLNQTGKTRGLFLPARGFGTFFENGDPPNNFWSRARFRVAWGGLKEEMLVATGDFNADGFDDIVVYAPTGSAFVGQTEPAAFHPAPGLFVNGAPLNGKPFEKPLPLQ